MKDGKRTAFALFFGVTTIFFIYIFIPNFRYTSDGLIAAIRMRDNFGFVHPNHPLHPLLLQILYQAVGWGKLALTELEMLHLWSNLIGVIGCWMIVVTLRTEIRSGISVLIGIGLFAFTNGVWFSYTAANPQATALTPHILCLLIIATIFTGRKCPRLLAVIGIGLITTFAFLSNQLNLLLLVPFTVVLLFTEASLKQKFILFFVFLGTFIVSTLILYISLGIVFAGVSSLASFIDWQHSYVFLDRWWALSLPDIIQRNFIGIVKVHISSTHESFGLFGNWLDGFGSIEWIRNLILRFGQAFVLGFLLIETSIAAWCFKTGKVRTKLQIIGLAAGLPLFLFSLVFDPESYNYRILYIPGLVLFLIPSLYVRYSLDQFRLKKAWIVIAFICCLFTLNFALHILPNASPDNNPFTNDLKILENMGEGDLVIYAGSDLGVIRGLYAEYFLKVDTWFANELIEEIRDNPEKVLNKLIERQARGRTLLIHRNTISCDEEFNADTKLLNTGSTRGELYEYFNTYTLNMGYYNSASYARFKVKDEYL